MDVAHLEGMIARSAAFNLAASYHQFQEAVRLRNLPDIRAWGRILMKDQERSGIAMLSPASIDEVTRTLEPPRSIVANTGGSDVREAKAKI